MRYNLFGVGLTGKSKAVTAQLRVNCYAEIQREQDRTQFAIYGTPGLKLFSSQLGSTAARCLYAKGNYLYAVHGSTFYQYNNAGVATSQGTLSTSSGNVSIIDNGTQIMLVDGTYGYIYTISSGAFAKITDANFPASPGWVTYQDQYFIVNKGGTAQFFISASGDGTTWSATNYATAESAPGTLQNVLSDHSILLLFGDTYTEFWQDTGALDFPYSRIPGSSQEYGLAASWSLCKYDNSVAGLFKNQMGEVIVARMQGFHLARLSNFELEYTINNYVSNGLTISDAVGFAYMLGGHPMYQLNFPTANATWLYDGATQLWSQLTDTTGTARHLGQFHADYLNQRIVSDYSSGNLYILDSGTYTDNGDTIPLTLISKHLWHDDHYLTVPSLQLDMQTGVGLATGQGSNPQVMLSISKDGGNTYGPEMFGSMGAVGQYAQRVKWTRLGRSRDWVFKLKITDPVKRVITGASMDVMGGTA